jgi:primosomal protein N' (replication factor Y)
VCSSDLDRIAVLHSHLSPSQRHWHWRSIARGEIQVVVGARSAVFAPTPNLGLIVLDEEHDASFKQDTAPRYHAGRVARQRATLENVPVVLGSATPSLESWHNAQTGTFRLVSLPKRVLDRPLPNVAAIDLRTEFQNRGSRGAISRPLQLAMKQALEAQGQVILLLNRRGFSTSIQCNACGHVVRCHECDIALTHHREGEKAICHYCDYQIIAPTNCPECNFEGIRYAGLGTQRLEAEVRSRFPNYQCLRMDSDTMQKHGSHEEAFARFRAGELQILLGTQMIAKGLDFPNVTLVGVINADTALHFPDFRAAERTFQLVTQVAGRTGRSERGGRVLVQTFSPDHPAIMAAMQHDYHRFASLEIPIRQEHGYPPFCQMARIIVRGESETTTEQFAEQIADRLRAENEKHEAKVRVLGPAPAPLTRLRGKFRFHLLLRSSESQALHDTIQAAIKDLKTPEEVQWVVDVDPGDML